MDREAHIDPLQEAAPSAELRERILSRCRREMAERRAVQRQWRWCFAAGVAALLLLNGVEEQRSAARINRLLAGPAQVAGATPASPATAGALRLRRLLLAALLKDPNSL